MKKSRKKTSKTNPAVDGKKILFLDDSQYRCEEFRERAPHAVIVHTAEHCIMMLKGSDWDEVHLDHDLGGESWVDSTRADTGMEVVRFMCCNTLDVRTVIVHSHNTAEAPHMVRALEAAGYYTIRAPFTYRNDEWNWHEAWDQWDHRLKDEAAGEQSID